MRRADLLIGIGLLLFAALYFQQSFEVTVGFASDRLGPAFFPRLLAFGLALCALALVVRAAANRSQLTPPPAIRTGLLMSVLALTTAYGLLLPRLGFVLATPLLLGGVMWLLGLRSWWKLISTSIGMTIVLYVVFGRALNVLLPMGPLGGR